MGKQNQKANEFRYAAVTNGEAHGGNQTLHISTIGRFMVGLPRLFPLDFRFAQLHGTTMAVPLPDVVAAGPAHVPDSWRSIRSLATKGSPDDA